MSEMKTASEWFKELPRAIEKKAIEAKLHHPNRPHTTKYSTLIKALKAFVWSRTDQGTSYWEIIEQRLLDGDPKMIRRKLAPRLPKDQNEYTIAIQLRTAYIEGVRAKNQFIAKELAIKALFEQTGITAEHISTTHAIKTK